MNYMQFAEEASREVYEFNMNHGCNPTKKIAYLGYDDCNELMHTVSPGACDLLKEFVLVHGFMVFRIDVKRHFELLVK